MPCCSQKMDEEWTVWMRMRQILKKQRRQVGVLS